MNRILYPAEARRFARRGRLEDVLQLIWAGLGTKEIAMELGLSPRTVDSHRARLLRVFRVRNAVSLCREAIGAGLLRVKRGRRHQGR